ncbi:MAG TPA: hypothetical protein DCY13_02730, partial [Verrucomicrobiales bacterium]|nr:hypothetical protein [Verrucomicrobiales bacterium]
VRQTPPRTSNCNTEVSVKTFLALLTLALPPTLVANHVHLHVAWRANALVLEIFDFEAGAFPADAYPFVIGNAGVLL